MPSIVNTFMAALAVAPLAAGHTWIEQLRNVNDKGEYVGQYGYPRGMVSKTDPGFGGASMNWELPGPNNQGNVFIDEKTPLCHPEQRKQQQSQDKYPRLQATPGGFITMRYTENGHVTLPGNQLGKPTKGGTIFIYGTTEPKEDEKLVNVLQWTEDGQGGDKTGKLITMNDFDDGRCYEDNPTKISKDRRKASPNFALGQVVEGAPGNYPLFCESNVKLPEDVTMGKPYTFYWVWQWNTAPGIDPGLPKGKDEYYTTCIDVDVASANVAMATEAEKEFNLGGQQDAMSVAVADFASRTALMTNAIQGEVGPVFSSSPSGPASKTGSATNTAVRPKPTLSAPYLNSTAPAPTQIPTLSRRPQRPGTKPTSLPANDNVVTVTDTVVITVTAQPTQAPAATLKPRAAHNIAHKNGAKFRRMFTP
ncbi:hypothetical protein ACN47E_004910 [Coniothyrium glycines]